MSETNPASAIELIQFSELHTNIWSASPATIGLTAAQANQYKAASAEAREAYDAVQQAKLTLKALVTTQTEKVRSLRTSNSNLLRSIRAFALQSANPSAVYSAAQIPPPAVPTTIGPPNPAYDLTAGLAILEGGVLIKWKATQEASVSGVVYKVERATTPAGPWTIVALTGVKNAVDTSIPQGTSAVLYRVVAQRGSRQSAASTALSIRFGTGPGGERVELTQSTVKLAA